MLCLPFNEMNKNGCLGARCVRLWSIYGIKQGIPWHFFCFSLFLYKLTQGGYVENIVLYQIYIIKIVTIWHTLAGIYGYGVCGFVLYVVGVEAST